MNRGLILFIKNPIAGKTKTRLAAQVGNDRALKMYDRLLTYTRTVALALPVRRFLYYSEFVDQEDGWSANDFDKHLQIGADLGARMEQAFADTFSLVDRAVIIGSDCPGITPQLLEQAFQALEEQDLVLGPARDGGYYLLGLRQPQPSLFRAMEWSTEEVAAETLQRAAALHLRVHQLPVLSDVDYLEDWQSYGWPVPMA